MIIIVQNCSVYNRAQKSFDILALYKSGYYYYYKNSDNIVSYFSGNNGES